jgi:formylglycine-generating enzyme required for sulfatase activity
MARIFISYSRKDETFARHLAADLDRLGADVWIDVDDIPAGVNWSTAIQQGLDSSDVMIVVISPDSMESTNVGNEWQYFWDHGHPVIPVQWRPAKVHFQLHRLQYIDFHTQDYDTAFAQLHAELRRKGVDLAPLSTHDSSAPIPVQKPLPTREERFPRPVLVFGVVIAVLVIAAVILALRRVTDGETDEDAVATRVVAQWQTQTATALTPRPSATAQPSATFTSEPTKTPYPTNTPEPSATHTAEPTSAPEWTPTFIPAWSRNADWTPIVQEINGIPMVYVPAGCFWMGSQDGGDDEKPVHRVCLSAFWIGQTEVTNAQYKLCVDAGVCTPPGSRTHYDDVAYADHPVVIVDWEQSSDFAEWINGSLPTEAQWEYAARGPEGWIYPWGDDAPACERAQLSGCVGGTAPVGPDQRAGGASWVGALDLSGNVWEWVADWYDESYYATLPVLPDSVLDPPGPASGSRRCLRGGSWNDSVNYARAAARNRLDPGSRVDNRGFRVVMSVPSAGP